MNLVLAFLGVIMCLLGVIDVLFLDTGEWYFSTIIGLTLLVVAQWD